MVQHQRRTGGEETNLMKMYAAPAINGIKIPNTLWLTSIVDRIPDLFVKDLDVSKYVWKLESSKRKFEMLIKKLNNSYRYITRDPDDI